MRLWSLHPQYLDVKGLTALWREGLLAQKVLAGKTKGYKNHPQLLRFKASSHPRRAISAYLFEVWNEATVRGYAFERSKISRRIKPVLLAVNRDQLRYEFGWLQQKLKKRSPEKFRSNSDVKKVKTHPLFYLCPGPVEKWEIIKS